VHAATKIRRQIQHDKIGRRRGSNTTAFDPPCKRARYKQLRLVRFSLRDDRLRDNRFFAVRVRLSRRVNGDNAFDLRRTR